MSSNRLLPDTCVWIDFFKGKRTLLAEKLEEGLVQGEIFTCGVVLYELLQGIKNSREETLLLNAFKAVPHLEMSAALWLTAGQLSSALRKKGQTLPLSDIVIATLALENKIPVLTIDRHFDAVPGLSVIRGE